MATQNWVNIGSGNGLLPDGTKPLPEPMLTNNERGPVPFIPTFRVEAISICVLSEIHIKDHWPVDIPFGLSLPTGIMSVSQWVAMNFK